MKTIDDTVLYDIVRKAIKDHFQEEQEQKYRQNQQMINVLNELNKPVEERIRNRFKAKSNY